jgi:hypothetical protein
MNNPDTTGAPDAAPTDTPGTSLASEYKISRWLRARDLEARAKIYDALNELDEAVMMASIAQFGAPDVTA